MSIISEIQRELHAPKSQTNKFGKYKYRSCEDIVTAVKPLLSSKGCHLTMSDEIISVADRVYVKAIATIYLDDKIVSQATASAREPFVRKGMDESQITGAASSYARKYALNGLLAIDDVSDADSQDNRGYAPVSTVPINEAHVQGAYEMLKAELDADKEEPDYDRMITGWSRISSDEQIAVFNLFGTDKPHGATKQYKSIIKECLAMKQQLDGTWL